MSDLLETESERLLAAVRSLLAQKGIASPSEISERIAITDRASPGQGARMVAKAWTDPAYRALMLEDGAKAAEAIGINSQAISQWPTELPARLADRVQAALWRMQQAEQPAQEASHG